MVPFAEEHIQDKFAGFFQTGGMGMDNHALVNWQRAGGLHNPGSINLYDTQPAAPVWQQMLKCAQGRDDNSSSMGSIQHRSSGWNLLWLAI